MTSSAGSRIVLYGLQTNNSNYVNNAIGVDQTYMWFSVDGTNTPLGIGGWRFYQNTNIVATIKSNGDFICKNINCDGLTVNSRDILNELDNKQLLYKIVSVFKTRKVNQNCSFFIRLDY